MFSAIIHDESLVSLNLFNLLVSVLGMENDKAIIRFKKAIMFSFFERFLIYL